MFEGPLLVDVFNLFSDYNINDNNFSGLHTLRHPALKKCLQLTVTGFTIVLPQLLTKST